MHEEISESQRASLTALDTARSAAVINVRSSVLSLIEGTSWAIIDSRRNGLIAHSGATVEAEVVVEGYAIKISYSI